MSYRLPNPVVPYPDESLAGLVVRDAERFRLSNPMRLFVRIGASRQGVASFVASHWTTDRRERLRELLGLEEAVLARMENASARAGYLRVLGEPLHRALVTLPFRRFCPDCLDDACYHRQVWDILPLDACTRHGTRLVRDCPACGKPLTWDSGVLHRCSSPDCRHDLRHATGVAVDVGTLDAMVGFERAFVDGLPPDVGPAGMPIGELLRLACYLGLFSAVPDSTGHLPADLLREDVAPGLVLRAGLAALRDWPRGFEELLDRLRSGHDRRRGRAGLRKSFGSLATWVLGPASASFGTVVLDAFNTHVARQPDLATRAVEVSRLRAAESIQSRRVTAAHARRMLDASVGRLEALADRYDLYEVAPTGKGAETLVRGDRLHELCVAKDAHLDRKAAARRLGVSKEALLSLEAAGVLGTVPEEGRIVEFRIYRVADIDGLFRRLEGAAVPATSPAPGGRLVHVDALARHSSTVEVLRAVLEGRLVPHGLDAGAVGVRRLLFAPTNVSRLSAPASRTLSVVEAAEVMRVKPEVCLHWARMGLLASTEGGRRPEKGTRISREAIAGFASRYLLAPEYAAWHGVGTKWVARHLAKLGVAPVSGPSVDGGRQYVFRRVDVEMPPRHADPPTGHRRPATDCPDTLAEPGPRRVAASEHDRTTP